jgi:gas vesicle structural protein
MPSHAVTAPAPNSLPDVVDIILDRGVVVDLYARVGLAGVEIAFVDARIVIASADTYLRLAEEIGVLARG